MLLEFQRELAAAISTPVCGALRVYRNTMLSGCVDALRANYPVVAQLLGEQMFEAIAAEHAAECPPREPVLALYGERLGDWLEEQAWIEGLPYLPDVARIERLDVEALFAADCDALVMEEVRGCSDWADLQLSLHPAARFDWLPTPAMSIWLSHQAPIVGQLDLDWHAEGALFTRPHLEVQPIRLDRAGHRFLFGIRHGESVGTAAIATVTLYPEPEIGSLFTSLVNAGVFAGSPHRSLS